jgi:hypothetical protein
MDAVKKHISESMHQIVDLYCDHVNVNEAVKSMRHRNTSAKVVRAIYDQLSAKYPNLTMGRFHYYYTHRKNRLSSTFKKWTSRYLLASKGGTAFHKIQITDLFNDKSM